MKKFILVIFVFVISFTVFAETSIGINFGGYSNFAFFVPSISLDFTIDPMEIFFGASFNIYKEKDYDYSESWFRLRAGIAPFIVKTDTLKVSLPFSVAFITREHNDKNPYSNILYGSWINLNAGIKLYKNISNNFGIYFGIYSDIFETNVTDIKNGDTIIYYNGDREWWFSGGFFEIGERLYLNL